MTSNAAPPDDWDDGAAPWTRSYPAGVPPSYPYPEVPVGRLLDDAAQDFPDLVAVEYRGYRLTYRKLVDHVDRLATALSGLGVGTGDRVDLILPMCPQLVIALFALWRLGAVAVLDDRARPPVDATGVVVTLDRWYEELAGGAVDPRIVIVTGRDDYLPFPRNAVAWVGAQVRRARRPRTVLRFADLIRRSHPAATDAAEPSDRTGALAGAGTRVTQRDLVVNSFQLRLWIPDAIAGDERVLIALPSSSPVAVLWVVTAVLSAATMVLVDEQRASSRQRAAVRGRPTILPLDTQVVADLLRSTWRRGTLRSVRIALSSDPLDPAAAGTLEQLTDKGRVRRAWGVAGVLTHADPIYGRVQQASVGLPLPDTTAVVADHVTGRRCELGARGRLWIRGPQLRGGEWVDTGLTARLDRDGYLSVDAPAAGRDADPPD